MKTFHELQEGLQDPNIFKAFFLAGGPGSGKSFVVGKTTAGTGLRIVNSDDVFEKYLDDAGFDHDMRTAKAEREAEERDKLRKRAKEITRYSVGERHQDYAGILFNYGKFYKNRANVPEAENSLTKALELYKNTVGVNHPDYTDCKRYLDNLYNPKYELYEPAPSEALLPIERGSAELRELKSPDAVLGGRR